MKPMRTKLIFMLAVCLTGAGAFAQSNNNNNKIPGPTDYASFSRFITDRNIFDPNRQPHYTSTRTRTVSRPRTHSASAPAFTLVGTMSYEKGIFAFFSGNSEDLKKALMVSGKIADYTVTDIDYGRVTLESTNKTEKLELKVGDVVREENGTWQFSGQGEVAAGSSATGSSARSSAESSSSGGDNGAPASASAPNDILKKLMEKREQENQ